MLVIGRHLPSALREIRDDFTSRPVLIGTLALGVILGISGPFDTFRLMPMLPRLAYWITVVVATYAIGSLISTLTHRSLEPRPRGVRTPVSALMIGVAVTAFLVVLNGLTFGFWPDSWQELVQQFAIVVLIAAVVETTSYMLQHNPAGESPSQTGHSQTGLAGDRVAGATPPATSAPPILQRLPLEKRGALVALSAEDHYVRVTTTKGEELVLMRLSDAIGEIGNTQGLQIHRSHWVSIAEIEKVTRNGERGEAVMRHGDPRPISRSYMPAVRKAGLLPKGRG